MSDIAILGAGAAGLFAAIRAAERGKKVVLLERNKKPGAKILMSGGTRCNITHDGSPDEVARAFGKRGGRFLRPSLLAYPPAKIIEFFTEAGVPVKTEPPWGKVFPKSNRATDVLAALVQRAREKGVDLRTDARVLSVRRGETGFTVALEGGEVTAPGVMVATGGKSYPKAGFTGDGYGIAKAFGHSIVTPRPALVPIDLREPLPEISGVALEDAKLGLAAVGGKILTQRRGEILFTHRGLSGPTALDLSSELTARTSGVVRDVAGPFEVVMDLIPGIGHESLQGELAAKGARTVGSVLHAFSLPRSLVQVLTRLAKVPEGRTLQDLRREERTGLVRVLKDLRLAVDGTLGFDKAEVTAGGVSLDEVDPGTLESKRVPGLFFIGEVLDLDGPVGGYNFQAAWSTGFAAGSAV